MSSGAAFHVLCQVSYNFANFRIEKAREISRSKRRTEASAEGSWNAVWFFETVQERGAHRRADDVHLEGKDWGTQACKSACAPPSSEANCSRRSLAVRLAGPLWDCRVLLSCNRIKRANFALRAAFAFGSGSGGEFWQSSFFTSG